MGQWENVLACQAGLTTRGSPLELMVLTKEGKNQFRVVPYLTHMCAITPVHIFAHSPPPHTQIKFKKIKNKGKHFKLS